MHEALVSKEDFEEVQKRLDNNTYIKKSAGKYDTCENSKNYFKGKVYCMDCNKKMQFMKYCYENRDGGYYFCGCKDHTKSSGESAELWKVHCDYLKIVVMDQIYNLIHWMCDKKAFVMQLQKDLKTDDDSVKVKRQVVQLKLKITELDEKLMLLYEDFSQGILDVDDYKYMKDKKTKERELVQEKLQEAETELRQTNRKLKEFMKLESRLEAYLGKNEFQETLIKELVDKICISQTNGIEICFKCADVIQQVVALEREDAM